ncbi:MAG TPA: hypothetical protein VIJ25_19155, partial [Methylococcales bacterium]
VSHTLYVFCKRVLIIMEKAVLITQHIAQCPVDFIKYNFCQCFVKLYVSIAFLFLMQRSNYDWP